MRVCYFGSYDPMYPRNKIIREGLALNGVDIVQCNIPFAEAGRGWQRYQRLLAQWQGINKSDLSAIILAEFNHKNLPLAWLLAHQAGVPLVFDPFVSKYDTNVEDRQRVTRKSGGALRDYILDLMAFHWPKVILADTQEHRHFFINKFGANPEQVHVVYVGADETYFYPDESNDPLAYNGKDEKPTILFFGSYIPLHGTDIIIRAFAHLYYEASKDFNFVMIGHGQTFPETYQLAQNLRLDNIEFVPNLSMPQLANKVKQATICLGIFGTTEKAQRVIPHKVFQSLSMAKPVITGDNSAIREIFISGQHLLTVPCGDERTLAEAILELTNQPEMAQTQARQGARLVWQKFNRRQIGQQVINVIQQILHA